jgi:hypothetical protein
MQFKWIPILKYAFLLPKSLNRLVIRVISLVFYMGNHLISSDSSKSSGFASAIHYLGGGRQYSIG